MPQVLRPSLGVVAMCAIAWEVQCATRGLQGLQHQLSSVINSCLTPQHPDVSPSNAELPAPIRILQQNDHQPQGRLLSMQQEKDRDSEREREI